MDEDTPSAKEDAVLKVLIEAGRISPPVPGTCPHRDAFGTAGFCGRPLLQTSDLCFWHARDEGKYTPEVLLGYFGRAITLKDAIEGEVTAGRSLNGVYPRNAPLRGSFRAPGVRLEEADLRGADLSHAELSYSWLRNANLAFCNLDFAFLGDADLKGANFRYATLHQAKLRGNSFEGCVGLSKDSFRGWKKGWPTYAALEAYPEQVQPVYRTLMMYFVAEGLLDDASWAAYRERLMRHQLLLLELKPLAWAKPLLLSRIFQQRQEDTENLQRLRWIRYGSTLFALIFSYASRICFGYGERPLRVLLVAGMLIFSYALAYALLGAVSEAGFNSSFYFSIVTFTTLGYGDVLPKPPFRLLAASEAVLGLVFSGLFLFTLARRAVARA
jgi:hypothetical protein